MLSFTNVVHFLTDEFSGLGGRGLALLFISFRPTQSFLFWHGSILSN